MSDYLACRTQLLVALFLVSIAAPAQGTTIDTIADWDGIQHTNSFGEGSTPTYGQVVTVPADNVLDSFTFELAWGAPNPSIFHAYVMEWAGTKATGPVLFSSGPMTLTTMDFFFHPQTILTGGLPLVSGNQYVLFFSTINDNDSNNDGANWGTRNSSDTYSGGSFVLNNGALFSDLSTPSWSLNWWGPGYDSAFQAVFSAMPAPGDVNADGVVDIFDINLVSAHWNEAGPVGDANGDHIVDIFDINLISAHWSPTPVPGGGAAVPEPTTLILALCGLLGAVYLRGAQRRA